MFLRTLVAAESGDSRRRVLETLDKVESLAVSVSSIEDLEKSPVQVGDELMFAIESPVEPDFDVR